MADNSVEFLVRMRDMMSGGLVKLAETSRRTYTGMATNMAAADRSTKFMSQSVNELKQRLKEVNEVRFGTVLTSEFRSATREARSLEAQISRMTGRGAGGRGGSLLGPLGGIGSLVRMAVPGLSLLGAVHLGTSSVKSAMNFEANRTAFEVLTGSKTRGDNLSEDLRGLKQNTILGASVYDTAKTMLGFGVSSRDVVKDIRMLGDVSMGNAEKLKHLTLAFSEVTASGRVTGKEIRQFINAGFNPLSEIARITHKSLATVRDEMRKGEISARMITDAFQSATGEGGRFNDMLGKMAETSAGKLQLMKGQWESFKIDLGNALMPVADKLLNAGTLILHALQPDGPTKSNLLSQNKDGMISLLDAASKLNQGDAVRKGLLQDLNRQYPDLFKNLDIEKVSNLELLQTLRSINTEYSRKISVASGSEQYNQAIEKVKSGTLMIDALNKRIALAQSGHLSEVGNLKDGWDFGFVGSTPSTSIRRWQQMIANENSVLNGNVGGYLGMNPFNGNFGNWQGNTDWRKVLASLQKTQPGAEFSDTIISAFDLAHNPDQLNTLFGGDKKARNSFLKLANRIKHRQGNIYDTSGGGMAFADQLRTAMDYVPKTPGSPGDDDGGLGGVARGIAGGGPRVINIGHVKFMDKLELHTATLKEGAKEIEDLFWNMFLRVLNSGASMQDR